MTYKLRGAAFITGAGSGIGARTAQTFAQYGIGGLTLIDLNQSGLLQTRDALAKEHPSLKVLAMTVDVTNDAAVHQAVEATVKEFGRIDIGLNAAGVGDVAKGTHELSVEHWQRVIRVNQFGTWLCERALVQQMLKQESLGFRWGRGVIINVASSLGLTVSNTGVPCPSYIASKHAIMGFTKMDAKFYAPRGIRINAICPGFVDTPMNKPGIESGALPPDIQSTPVGRMAQVEEIADAILFLASPMSSFMYGAGLVVDGGYGL